MIDPKFREAHEALDNAIQFTQNLTIAAWELANGLDSESRTGNALLGTLSLAEEKTMEAEEASAAVWEAMKRIQGPTESANAQLMENREGASA